MHGIDDVGLCRASLSDTAPIHTVLISQPWPHLLGHMAHAATSIEAPSMVGWSVGWLIPTQFQPRSSQLCPVDRRGRQPTQRGR
jgi:hypothetical protein